MPLHLHVPLPGPVTYTHQIRPRPVLTTCRCEEAWTNRGLHATECTAYLREDVEVLAAELRRMSQTDGMIRDSVRAALVLAASEEDPVWSGRTIMRATDLVCRAIIRKVADGDA